jgi:hypothetical protein
MMKKLHPTLDYKTLNPTLDYKTINEVKLYGRRS